MPENRSREYQSSVSGDSPVAPRRSIPQLAGAALRFPWVETESAERLEDCCCCPEQLAQILFSSSWLSNYWRRRTRKITNTQRERRLRGVNCRLRVVAGCQRHAEITFGTNDLGVCAQALLVRFEHCVECALRRRQ